MENKPLKIVYCTPALYLAGGIERVLTLKANYFAEHFGYDITIILTEGKGKPLFYPLSDKIKVINLDINFEVLWNCSFIKKIVVYLWKQQQYRKKLKTELMRIRPDITDSLLRREINFINEIKDGSKKIGELHTSRQNNRSFKDNELNFVKILFAKYWNWSLIRHLRKLDKFIVLTNEDRTNWKELENVTVIHNPVSFKVKEQSHVTEKRILSVGRYDYIKGYDRLLKAWSIVEKKCPDWSLSIYGDGDKEPYLEYRDSLGIDSSRCILHGVTSDIQHEYLSSSMYLVTSRFEGLGMAMLEAMSCGLPLVSFACPCGPRDVIENGVNGYLVENGDVEELAEKIVFLAKDYETRRQMGQKAIEKCKQFNIEHIADKWNKLFNSIVKQ